jgi:hypothetical protein
MLAALRRHPLQIQAYFRRSLVLTFAYPESLLAPLLPPGLVVDSYQGLGFLAIAMVQTEGLRPVGAPAFLGRDFFLTGYRIFSRLALADGKILRGLRILRSDADSALMVRGGNLLTHYNYTLCKASQTATAESLVIEIATPGGRADLTVAVDLISEPVGPPAGSPFPDLQEARKFAGPLPFTFDYEAETHSIVVIQGVRQNWNPRPVSAEVRRCAFLESEPFKRAPPRLANSFFVENIPYRWEKGFVVPLSRETR